MDSKESSAEGRVLIKKYNDMISELSDSIIRRVFDSSFKGRKFSDWFEDNCCFPISDTYKAKIKILQFEGLCECIDKFAGFICDNSSGTVDYDSKEFILKHAGNQSANNYYNESIFKKAVNTIISDVKQWSKVHCLPCSETDEEKRKQCRYYNVIEYIKEKVKKVFLLQKILQYASYMVFNKKYDSEWFQIFCLSAVPQAVDYINATLAFKCWNNYYWNKNTIGEIIVQRYYFYFCKEPEDADISNLIDNLSYKNKLQLKDQVPLPDSFRISDEDAEKSAGIIQDFYNRNKLSIDEYMNLIEKHQCLLINPKEYRSIWNKLKKNSIIESSPDTDDKIIISDVISFKSTSCKEKQKSSRKVEQEKKYAKNKDKIICYAERGIYIAITDPVSSTDKTKNHNKNTDLLISYFKSFFVSRYISAASVGYYANREELRQIKFYSETNKRIFDSVFGESGYIRGEKGVIRVPKKSRITECLAILKNEWDEQQTENSQSPYLCDYRRDVSEPISKSVLACSETDVSSDILLCKSLLFNELLTMLIMILPENEFEEMVNNGVFVAVDPETKEYLLW